jgi:hypothetical protein
MLIVVMLSVIMLNVESKPLMVSAIMLSGNMRNIKSKPFILSVIMLSVFLNLINLIKCV